MIHEYLRALLSGIRVGRYASVGLSGFLVDNAMLVGLVEVVGLHPIVGKLIAAELSIVFMFVLNERWTFSEFGIDTTRAVLRRFYRSNLVRMGGLVVSVVVLYLLHVEAGLWYLIANVIGIACGFVVSFSFESLYIWRAHG